jgi:hypothetical protein
MAAPSDAAWLDSWGHVIEAHSIPAPLASTSALTRFLSSRLPSALTSGLSILWFDDENALLAFPNANIANEVLTTGAIIDSRTVVFRQMTQPFKLRFEAHSKEAIPGPTRPDTDARVANRLIKHALGSRRDRDAPKTAASSQAAYLKDAPEINPAAAASRADADWDWRSKMKDAERKAAIDAEEVTAGMSKLSTADTTTTGTASPYVLRASDTASSWRDAPAAVPSAPAAGAPSTEKRVRGRGANAGGSGLFAKD